MEEKENVRRKAFCGDEHCETTAMTNKSGDDVSDDGENDCDDVGDDEEDGDDFRCLDWRRFRGNNGGDDGKRQRRRRR